MRALLQRVRHANVVVEGETVGAIEGGLLIFLGVGQEDDEATGEQIARKAAELRIFPDDEGKMNRSLLDAGGGALVVSQFTLYADCRKGRRPSFVRAGAPDHATALCDHFAHCLRGMGVHVETGRFGADMQVTLLNDGPVTILLDSDELARSRRG